VIYALASRTGFVFHGLSAECDEYYFLYIFVLSNKGVKDSILLTIISRMIHIQITGFDKRIFLLKSRIVPVFAGVPVDITTPAHYTSTCFIILKLAITLMAV